MNISLARFFILHRAKCKGIVANFQAQQINGKWNGSNVFSCQYRREWHQSYRKYHRQEAAAVPVMGELQ